MILRLGGVFMGRFDLSLRTRVVIATDQLSGFFVRLGSMFHVLSSLCVVLLGCRCCRRVVGLSFVECHGSFFQKLEKA